MPLIARSSVDDKLEGRIVKERGVAKERIWIRKSEERSTGKSKFEFLGIPLTLVTFTKSIPEGFTFFTVVMEQN